VPSLGDSLHRRLDEDPLDAFMEWEHDRRAHPRKADLGIGRASIGFLELCCCQYAESRPDISMSEWGESCLSTQKPCSMEVERRLPLSPVSLLFQ
jgi:hypothetical protein